MAITVIMQDSRPDGAGGTYKKGSTYSLPDTLATYFIDIGLAKRTSTRSEQTGTQITGDSAGRFPSAPAQDAEETLKVRRNSDQGIIGSAIVKIGYGSVPLVRVATFGDSTANFGGSSGVLSNTDQETVIFAAGLSGATAMQWGLSNKITLPWFYPSARIVANGGISGETTQNMLDRESLQPGSTRRALSDVIATNPDVLLGRFGSINDIFALSLTTYATKSQLDAIYARHCALLQLMIASPIPLIVDEGIAGYDAFAGVAGQKTYIRDALIRLNKMYADYIDSLKMPGRVVFLDLTGGVSSDSTGAFLPGVSPAADGTHDCIYGGIRRGQAEAAIITAIIGPSAPHQGRGVNLYGSRAALQVGGALPSGASWYQASTTQASSGIKSVNGKPMAYYVSNAVTAAGYVLLNLSLPINSGAADPKITLTAGQKIVIECDTEILTNDGSPLPAGVYPNIRADVYNTGTGRLTIDSGSTGGVTQDTAFPASSLAVHVVTPIIEIDEPSANIGASTAAWVRWNLPTFSPGFEVRVGVPRITIVL